MVEMVPVASSNVKAVGYDPEERELHVHFHSGGRYVYEGVSHEAHRALLAAPSVGSHLHQHIKGRHQHRKL